MASRTRNMSRRTPRTRGQRQGHGTSGALARALQLYESKRLDEANTILAPVLRQTQPPADALLLGAGIALRRGDTETATRLVNRAVRRRPHDLQTRLIQAEILVAREQLQEALDLLLALHRQGENDPQLLAALGRICRQGGQPEAALKFLQAALDAGGENPDVLVNLGNVLYDLDHLDTAQRCFEHVLALAPDHGPAALGLATLLRGRGRLHEAAAAAARGTGRHPTHGALAVLDAQLTPPTTSDDPRVPRLEEVLASGGLGAQDTSLLHFALADLKRRLGDHAGAMQHYQEANRWRARYLGRSFSLARTLDRFASYCRLFTPEFFAARADWGLRTDLPVFIVGMPRSGTTLIENILGRHPLVHAAGERQFVGHAERSMLGREELLDPTDAVTALTREQIAEAARSCLATYRQLAPDAQRIVDKMPHNFEKLWLIALLFPGARVVHARRSPLDNCLSCFFTPLSEPHGYRNDLSILGHYYRAYRKLMEHWQRVLPLDFLDVQYEELTAHQQEQSQRLVRWCGLDWHPGCLDFQRGDVVRTASATQVRQGMYRSSVGRWHHYAGWLEPLREGLGPQLVAEAEALSPAPVTPA